MILIIAAIAVILLIPVGRFAYSIFFGCGFDDGPFKAVLTTEEIRVDSAEVFQINTEEILLDNRSDSLPPLVGFKSDGEMNWVLDLDLKNTKKYDHCSISRLYNVEVQDYGDSFGLVFTAVWTYGHERGRMTVKKRTAKNHFCLSW